MHQARRLTQAEAAYMGYDQLVMYRRIVRRDRNERYLKKNQPKLNAKKMFMALQKYQNSVLERNASRGFHIMMGMSRSPKNDTPRLTKNEAPFMHEMVPQVNL